MVNNRLWFCAESTTAGHAATVCSGKGKTLHGKGLISQKRFSHRFVHASAVQPSPSGSSNFPGFVNLTFGVRGSKSGYCLLHLLCFCSRDFNLGGIRKSVSK